MTEPEGQLIGVCRDRRLRLKKPIPAAVDWDKDTEQYVVTFARGDVTTFGYGRGKGEAMEDFVDAAGDDFKFLSRIPNEKLSVSLVLEKSVLGEYFEWRQDSTL